MIKISRKQRTQLIALGAGAVVVVVCLWYFVVNALAAVERKTEKDSETMRAKLKDEHATVYQAEKVGLELTNAMEKLKQREAGFAPEHEPYSWMRGLIDHFYQPSNGAHPYKSVANIDFKQPEISEKGIIAGFPYKWATFHITGEGRYLDFGKFIADFESAYPYFRIQEVDITLPGVRSEPNMLAFSFDIVTPQMPAPDTK